MDAALAFASHAKPTVLIADDHPTVVGAASDLLFPHCRLVSTVGDGIAALNMAVQTNPDLVVLDVHMPKMNGFRTAQELSRRMPRSKVVFLTAQEDDDYISEALKLGALGYVAKRRLHSDLVAALNLALNDRFFVSPHAFVGIPKSEASQHVLQFYADEVDFLRQVSDLTFTALNNNELVFMFLRKSEIAFVGRCLQRRGFDYRAAIRNGRYWIISTESVLSGAHSDGPADAWGFHALFRDCLRRAAARSEGTARKLTIFSDLMATLISRGCSSELTARLETGWNQLVPKRGCIVYCGCPISELARRSSRESLVRLCPEHDDAIAIGHSH